MSRQYQICSKCVMDTSDAAIHFDRDGVCNHCHDYTVHLRNNQSPTDELGPLVEAIKRDGKHKQYDCVIGVSGGVDSSYTAWKVREAGLRPLAVHLDNGWNTEIAVCNIQNLLKALSIDLYTHVLEWGEFRDIQRAFLLASVPDAEIPSDHAIFAVLYKVARQYSVRYVITGINVKTETHVPLGWSRGHWDWGYIRAIHNRFGSVKVKTFPHFSFYDYVSACRHTHQTVDLLNYLDYSKRDAVKQLEEELGWRPYGGKHHENIYTRWYQGCYLPKKFGFDKRRCHLSSLICSGQLTRAEALEELKVAPYDGIVQEDDYRYVAKKLGFSLDELDAIFSAPIMRFEDYPSYFKATNSAWFRAVASANSLFRKVVPRRRV